MRVTKSIFEKATALLGALLLFDASAGAQTISNTAHASWSRDGIIASSSSNRVDIEVSHATTLLETFRPVPGASTQIPVMSSVCGGQPLALFASSGQSGTAQGGGGLQAAASTQQRGTATSDAIAMVNSVATRQLQLGEQLILRFTSALANIDSSALDSIQVLLTTGAGDRETIEIFETAIDSGVFTGAIGTRGLPPTLVQGDCLLSASSQQAIEVEVHAKDNGQLIATSLVDLLADPFGLVFDSEDGTPVSGAIVRLVEAASGAPATVFAEDGVTSWPSTVVTGSVVRDGAGNSYQMLAGEYRFPLAAFGEYRLIVEPPAPYGAPSDATPQQLANLTRPDGAAFLISDASYGGSFALASTVPVRVDVPIDRPGIVPVVSKTASRAKAQPGDPIFYTLRLGNPDTLAPKENVRVIDTPSQWLRFREDSVLLDGVAADDLISVSEDGATLSFTLDSVPAGGERRVSYAMTLRADAPPGQAINRVDVTDNRGRSASDEAVVQIEADNIAGRMTIIGRITAGPCVRREGRPGIAGVRVMLEDGSFAITDEDGRYHFEGVVPGTHVVAVQPQTLPEGGEFIDCIDSTRSAGSAVSRFVIGQGGSLAVADFHADLSGYADILVARMEAERVERQAAALAGDSQGALPQPAAPAPMADGPAASALSFGPVLDNRTASGADADWLAMGDGPNAFLFPALDHNPRIPALRVVIRHRAGQKVELAANGEPVDRRNFELTQTSESGGFAVSIWRGIPLVSETTQFMAVIRNDDGSVADQLERSVAFTSAPWRAEIIDQLTNLVADGRTRPIVAVRLTDRRGRPIRSGVTGNIAISEPYQSAATLDQMQLGQLTGQGSASANWTVAGDDGIALIELAPTMVSGPLHLDFTFSDGDTRRQQQLESWVVPGDLDWTLVGLAEGSIGARSVADNMERSGRFDSDLGEDARVAFYAKGRILGSFLLTMAYDSAKAESEQRLLGTIDPSAYYTVFADGSDRRFDAASREKLYVRIEAASFYALYGDFVTGFDQTTLARYQRTATGVKAEGRFGDLHAQGFVTQTASRYRRDEIQGGGISGPYALSDRNILANSEIVAIEVRDRFRSEVVVERRDLVRFIDYDLDILSGTISFKQPVLSRDFDLNPQFIVIDYEVAEGSAASNWNAGARADYTIGDDLLRLGATGITDRGEGARTDIAALDARLRLGGTTEVRAEFGLSTSQGEEATGWLIEAEHRTGSLDVIAYARSLDADYGTGQQTGAELGRRKLGVDARYGVGENLALVGSAWYDESLTDITNRRAVQLSATYRAGNTDGRIGIARFDDHLADGTNATSTILEGGVTQRLLDNKLELSATTSIALDKAEALDLPARHQLRARYSLTEDVRLVGTYEIADGASINARTFQAGLEVSPWSGSRIVSSLGQEQISELGSRSFAAFGLSQSLPVSPNLTLDLTLDGNRQIGGVDAGDILNTAQPVASGGAIASNGALFEDFTAASFGASWRKDKWSATTRAEYRGGEFADRYGLTTGVVRQMGDGVIVGGGFNWTYAEDGTSVSTEIFDGALAAAFRPAESEFAFLSKLEFRSDAVTNAVLGASGPAGRSALNVAGNALSRRLIASLSTNWSPRELVERGQSESGEAIEEMVQRSEIALFIAARYNLDEIAGYQIAGTTLLAGLDARYGLSDRIEIGARAAIRSSLADGTTSYSFGPQIGFVPADNTLLLVGYNIAGFNDPDFSALHYTNRGLFASLRLKFDSSTLGFLGLER